MAELEKELAEETKVEKAVKESLEKIKRENNEFLQGPDADLDDETNKLMTELNEVKEKIQPSMRPLQAWKRSLHEKISE